MKTYKLPYIITAICICLISNSTFAQFKLGAEVRPRSEFRNGFKKLIDKDTQKPAFFTEQRTRLTMDYQSGKTAFYVSFQDVRIWGAESQIYKPGVATSPYFTSIHQAWGQFDLGNRWKMKIGRQELDYDNARFLGNLAWAQQSRSHDAVLFTFADSTQAFHLGGAFNQDGNTPEYAKLLGTYYDRPGNYKTMQFAWYKKKFAGGSLSLLFFNNGVQALEGETPKTRFSQTFGGITHLPLGQTKLELEGYYQFGKDPTDKTLSALLLAASLTKAISQKVSLTIGGDYVSGTSMETKANKNNSFSPLYGTNHKFYGFMDYFYVGNPSAQGGRTIGLINPYLKTKWKLPKGSALMAHVHHFVSPVKIYQNPSELGGETVSSSLGTEIDLVFATSISSGVSLNIGYSQLFATESMQLIKGGNKSNLQNWAWVMLTFKPTLFSTEK